MESNPLRDKKKNQSKSFGFLPIVMTPTKINEYILFNSPLIQRQKIKVALVNSLLLLQIQLVRILNQTE
jgi:hypothetical protein